VIGRSLGQLFYRRPTGEQGALWPLDDSTFAGSTSVGTSYPLPVLISFATLSPRATMLHWGSDSETPRSASRIEPYEVEDVAFTNGDVRLAGTIFMPRTPGPHPGVVLVHGSNAQSRNGQRSIYRFHADHLARRGIAVLIYDKRGIGGSGGHWDSLGIRDDVVAALRTLRRHAGVDSDRVGLWGLSQGAWLVGHAAALVPDEVAFIVPVGGGALSPEDQEKGRTMLQMLADGFSDTDLRRASEIQSLKFHYARTGEGWDKYLAAVEQARDAPWLGDPYIGPPTSRDSPAWEFWRSGLGSKKLDPRDDLRSVRCPVFVIIGERDTYSPPEQTLERFRSLLTHADSTQSKSWLVPGASHAIYEAKTGGPKEEPYLSRFVPGYLDTLAAWIGRVRPQAATSR